MVYFYDYQKDTEKLDGYSLVNVFIGLTDCGRDMVKIPAEIYIYTNEERKTQRAVVRLKDNFAISNPVGISADITVLISKIIVGADYFYLRELTKPVEMLPTNRVMFEKGCILRQPIQERQQSQTAGEEPE